MKAHQVEITGLTAVAAGILMQTAAGRLIEIKMSPTPHIIALVSV